MANCVEVRLKGRLGRFDLDVAFSLPPAGVTGLVGPSGSGKSTLLRALAGLERLDGHVRVGEAVWQDGARFEPPHKRAVGYVFQHSALLPHLSVRGNLLYVTRRARAAPGALEAAVERFGLTSLLERSPERLSGGERQRVGLARALLSQPRLVLLDEPLSSLDVAARAELLQQLRTALSDVGVPSLYVSHDPAEVAQLTDRVLSLNAGRLGPPPCEPLHDRDALAGLPEDRVLALARAALRAGIAPS